MDNNLQPSFIPRKPLSQPAITQEHPKSLFSIIAIIIFVLSLLSAGGIYGYEYYLNNTLQQKNSALQTELNTFEPTLITDLSSLDAKISTANSLLNAHISTPRIFSAISAVTLMTVRLTSFNLSYRGGSSVVVAVVGQGKSYASVDLQQAEFQKPEYKKFISSSKVSGVSLDKNGGVNFSATLELKPNYFLYATAPVSASSTKP